MARKLLSVILALCILIGCLPMAASAEETAVTSGNCGPEGSESSVTWNYDTTTKTLTISGTGEMANYQKYKAPWYSFDVSGVVIGEGVTSIGEYAFAYKNRSYTLPSTLKKIGNYAFYYAVSSTKDSPLVIPEGVVSIGDHAFAYNNYHSNSSIKLPSTLKEIGYEAFAYNKDLEITIPENVETIGEQAFCGIKSIALNSNNKNFVISDGLLMDTNKTKVYDTVTNKSTYTLPNTLTTIGYGAFEDNDKLTSITIPDSVTDIVYYSFASCENLASVNLPSSLTSIGVNAFLGCESLETLSIPASTTSISSFIEDNNLTSISVDENNTNYTSINGVLFTADKSKLVTYPGKSANTTLTIPKETTYISINNCDNLQSITVDADNTVYASENDLLYKKATSDWWTTLILVPPQKSGEIILDVHSEWNYNGGNYNDYLDISADAINNCKKITSVKIANKDVNINRIDDKWRELTSLTNLSYTYEGASVATVDGLNYTTYFDESCLTFVPAGIKNPVIEDGTKIIWFGALDVFQGTRSDGGKNYLESVTIPSTVTEIKNSVGDSINVKYDYNTHTYRKVVIYGTKGSAAETFVNENPYYYVFRAGTADDYVLTPDWSAVTAKTSVPYGTKNSGFVTLPSIGTATIDDTTLNGTFTVVDGDTVQDCGERTVTVQFTVTSDGDYKGMTYTKDYTVTVAAKSVDNSMISAIPAVTYNGAAHEPTLTVKNGSTTLVKDTDYTVAYTNNTNAGTATATITGIGNYTGTASQNFTINKAAITGYQTAAPTATILANDANNTAANLKTAANLPATVTVTYAGGTATLPITWANASEKFNVKGGTYAFKGIVPASENFNAYTTPLTATLTVTPVNGTLNTTVPSSVVIAQNTAQNATSYADFKLPTSIVINCDNSVTQQTITPTWSVSLSDLKSKKVGSKTTVKVTNLPEWLTMNDVTVTVEITDKFPVTVTVGAISDVTYGTEIANPSATQTAISDGTDSSATFTYTYTGTTASGAAYNSAVKPTEAGDYTVTATLVSNTHAGSGSTTFKILPKNLDNSMIGAIASVTYNGKAQEPTLTVTDGSVTLVKDKDFTVTYTNNTAVGTATATVTGKGNYTGTASKDFMIDPIDISTMTVKVEGTAEVEQALLASVEGVEPVEFNWFVDGTKIDNYTLPYLLLKPEHENKEITVSATASGNYGGTTAVSDAKTIAVATGDVVSSDVPEKAEITASTGNRQITVKATAESEKPIALYAFKLCDSSDNVIKTVYSLTDSHTFTELTNGTEYHVSAVAFNVNGEGTWSDSKSATPKAPSYSGGGSSSGSTDENDEPDVTIPLPNGSTVTIDKDDDGNVTVEVTNKDGEKVIEITIPSKPGSSKIFADVKNDAWYKNAVDKATGYGIFNGVSESKFAPKDTATRGMIAQTLYNLSGKTEYGTDSDSFTDSKGWYQDAVNWAAAAGVVNGMGNGKFEPKEEITREQLVVMLYNFAQAIGDEGTTSADLSKFTDAKNVSSWANEAMQWAVANGLMNGSKTANGMKLNPKDTATRAEVATVLVNFVEYLK